MRSIHGRRLPGGFAGPRRRLVCSDASSDPGLHWPNWPGGSQFWEMPPLLIGPVFTREAILAPRRPRLYISRAAYVGALFLLMGTAWLLLAGTQVVRNIGDMARFGAILFQILAPLQLAVALFGSALFAAGAVSQEKDRRTLTLLLLTNLTNSELVLGKLLASLLQILFLLVAALPLFVICTLLGGIALDQVVRVFAMTVVSALAAGSLGSTCALWRETTFQAIAITLLAMVGWIAIGEAIGLGFTGATFAGITADTWPIAFNPFRAVLLAARPTLATPSHLSWAQSPANLFVVMTAAAMAVLDVVAIVRVRRWNRAGGAAMSQTAAEAGTWETSAAQLAAQSVTVSPSEAANASTRTASSSVASRSVHAAPGATRDVWDNPILWREVRTWAYGRKILALRVVYLALAFAAGALLGQAVDPVVGLGRGVATAVLAPLFVLSLVLVNAQAVTALTVERDLGAIDLLLVTDLTAKEFVFGKLFGILYNSKELILAPVAVCLYLWRMGAMSGENCLYLALGMAVMDAFVAMLGIHAGMSHNSSRSAIAASLGAVFFLFLGVATCMRMMIAFSGAFHFQLAPFFVLSVGGGVGMYASLGVRNPSPAIGVASFACPSATFYAITSYLQESNLGVFLVIVATYAFATAAMLVPAIYEFDVATGRTTSADG